MSGFIRTIERAAKREVYFNGRGSRIAVKKPAARDEGDALAGPAA